MVAVAARPRGGVPHRQGVHLCEHGECLVVSGGRLLQEIFLKQVSSVQEPFEIRC